MCFVSLPAYAAGEDETYAQDKSIEEKIMEEQIEADEVDLLEKELKNTKMKKSMKSCRVMILKNNPWCGKRKIKFQSAGYNKQNFDLSFWRDLFKYGHPGKTYGVGGFVRNP